MIRVTPQPEPESFDANVRQPGKRFLEKYKSSPIDWKKGSFWSKCQKDLYELYGRVCCYAAV